VLVGCALSASAGQLFLTEAYRAERAARVAAASYVGPVWALVADVVVFGVWPRAEALVGGAIIVGAGLVLLRNSPKSHVDEVDGAETPVAVPR
jgi:drug/metabolite transporter (DMT)-like permease